MADDKDAAATQAAQQRADTAQDDEPIAALQAPRPGADEALPAIASRSERAMSAAEKAEQTDRVLLRLSERSERVRARLQQAREQDDSAQVNRQQLILARLDQRVTVLQERSQSLHEQASLDGDVPEPAHPAADDHAGHAH